MSDPAGRALAALAGDGALSAALLGSKEMDRLTYRHGLIVPASRLFGEETARARHLSAVAARLQARQRVMDEHLKALLETMAVRGIRASVVKGPQIAARYRDPSIRTYTDVDLVVPPDQLEAATDALREYPSIDSIPAKLPRSDKRDVVVRDRSGIVFTIDLHWNLFGHHQLGSVGSGAMVEAWATATHRPDHVLGPMWVFSDEVMTSFLSLHALLDHRFRIILFRDLLEIAETNPDWPSIADFAIRHKLAGFQRIAWLIAREVLDAPVPDEFLALLARRHVLEFAAEWLLARTDLVRFDGRRQHPLNLAITLLHDDAAERRRLIRKAPLAFSRWRRRVGSGDRHRSVDRRRLMVLVSSDARRGAEVFGRRLADSLTARAWDASVVSLEGTESPGVDTLPLLIGDGGGVRGMRPEVFLALWRRMRMDRPAIVFANGGATLRYAALVSLVSWPRPSVVYGAIGQPSFWLRGPIHRLIQRVLIATCLHVTAVSEASKAELVSVIGVAPSKVTVIHPGLEDGWFQVVRREDGALPLRVLFAGSLSSEKDPMTAVNAVARLSGAAKLRVVGEGPLRPMIEAAGGNTVELLGSVDEMVSQFQWADVLLLTSVTEGLPGVVVEAAAAGIPVVASRVGGTGEAVVHGETGYLISPGDVEGFAEALSRLAADEDLRRELGDAGRRYARQRFRLADSVDAYDQVFRGVS